MFGRSFWTRRRCEARSKSCVVARAAVAAISSSVIARTCLRPSTVSSAMKSLPEAGRSSSFGSVKRKSCSGKACLSRGSRSTGSASKGRSGLPKT